MLDQDLLFSLTWCLCLEDSHLQLIILIRGFVDKNSEESANCHNLFFTYYYHLLLAK